MCDAPASFGWQSTEVARLSDYSLKYLGFLFPFFPFDRWRNSFALKKITLQPV